MKYASKPGPGPGPGPWKQKLPGPGPGPWKTEATGTGTGTMDNRSYRDQTGTGTEKAWSRTSLVYTHNGCRHTKVSSSQKHGALTSKLIPVTIQQKEYIGYG